MRLAVAQLNPIVGDLAGNVRLIRDAMHRAREAGADALLTAELALIGYPPRDLLLRRSVVADCERAVRALAAETDDLTLIVGHPRTVEGGDGGDGRCFNSASVCRGGRVIMTYDKRLLPGYDVFDEDRYFQPADRPAVVEIAGARCGLLICEDFWRAADVRPRDGCARSYPADPVADTCASGCDALLVLNASPFVLGKHARHLAQMQATARERNVAVIAAHQVGANDDLIFDGRSVAVGPDGSVLAQLPACQSAVEAFDVPAKRSHRAAIVNGHAPHETPAHDPLGDVFDALTLGLRDYVHKTGHTDVLLGLSGGIDSSLVAALAVAALGPEHVHGVLMPSRHSSPGSITDAAALASNLDMRRVHRAPIEPAHDALTTVIGQALRREVCGVTDENIQARVRGIILMAMSNDTSALVLATSNKSEAAVGYSTLYGDMCGALAPIADLYKHEIYALSNWLNAHHQRCGLPRPPIPHASIHKPPSAELRADQTDQDTLPPYDVLDRIVELYVDREASVEQIVADAGLDDALVRQWTLAIDRSQYKRDQAPVILKVHPRAFGPGRPMPIVMKQTAVPASQPQTTG